MRDKVASGATETADAAPPSTTLYIMMMFAAAAGGWVAVALAVLPALGTGGTISLFLFILAPFYEEALKPLGVYYVFLRWPHVALSRVHVVMLSAVGGLAFAFVENWLYLEKYPDQGDSFVLFRFTAPLAMHVASSAILGTGLTRAVLPWLAGRSTLPAGASTACFTAVGVHAAYNLTVLFLAIIGTREFVEQTGA